MNAFGRNSRLSDVLANPAARALVSAELAGIVNSPQVVELQGVPLGLLADRDPILRDDPAARDDFWSRLAAIENTTVSRIEAPALAPDPDYEGLEVTRSSASMRFPAAARRFEVVEIVIDGPSHGNPFIDVDLFADFHHLDTSVRVGGFYDGGGRYVIRFLPEIAGVWEFTVTSTARSIDGVDGVFRVMEEALGHGPVRVADTFHFAHADGARHLPLGTTAYAWTHQPDDLQERTLRTLADSPFTKIRMCLFPKSYEYNRNEPDFYPFVRAEDGHFDLTTFDPRYFANLERRIKQLDELGIQADLILFHPYDRWGFSDLGRAADERYLRYVVRRLAAFSNVWWSMANEFDLMWSKSTDDWERLAGVVVAEDPNDHLISIHNCFDFYDYSRPWITHASMQRTDVYKTAENTATWRLRWSKPVVIDECAYEGDLEHGWGNITAEEMVRRFWEGAVRGGYVNHGETYFRDDEVIWWSKGGELVGQSPPRIAFLRRVLEDAPDGVLDPLPSEWDAPTGGGRDQWITYFGFNRPAFRTVTLPADTSVIVEVLDTWNMTVTPVPGVKSGTFIVQLPSRQYMALRFTRA